MRVMFERCMYNEIIEIHIANLVEKDTERENKKKKSGVHIPTDTEKGSFSTSNKSKRAAARRAEKSISI